MTLALVLTLAGGSLCAEQAKIGKQEVRLVRVPNGGIQPQVAVDEEGTVHLVYFKGDPANGNVFYVRSTDGGDTFSPALGVNSQPESAVATGTIRGAQIAVGSHGRVHVAWNGSTREILYARLNDAGTGFEPQRNLMTKTFGLDGGGSVAADGNGRVYVVWHGKDEGAPKGEAGRRVWLATSRDAGKSFSAEVPAFGEPTGACGCCGLRAFAGKHGRVHVLYRSATEMVNRDIYLLVSENRGEAFRGKAIHKWNIGACPMSSMTLIEGPKGVLAAWQTKEQVYYAAVDAGSLEISEPVPAPGTPKLRKYPKLAVNARGETIFLWSENAGWGKGGSLAWQVFDEKDKPNGEKGISPELPKWSFGAVFARPDGGFTILN